MSPLHALLLGALEGLTEFLPISSTAHLILASAALRLPQGEFQKTFEVVIQLGAILAVIAFYGRSFLLDRAVLLRVFVAFVPTAIIGLLLHKLIKDVLFESVPVILWSLFLGGLVLVLFERSHREKETDVAAMADMSYRQAFLIGCCQSLAVVPGVSRAGATIVGGQLLGVRRKAIVDFSFVLAAPTIAAAAALDLLKAEHRFATGEWLLLALGLATAFVTALFAIRWLLGYVKGHSFAAFGVYRMVLAIAVWALLIR